MPAAALAAVLDLSALDPAAAGHPVARDGAALCAGPAPDGVIAVAAVIYGRSTGRSAWGHASVRALSCAGGALVDREYEAYRSDPAIHRYWSEAFPDEPWAHDAAYLRRQAGKLVLLRNERPVDGGFYARELARDREITELWLPLDPATAAALIGGLDAAYAAQLEALRARAPLVAEAYHAMGTNCTAPPREALAAALGAPGERRGSVYPMRLIAELAAVPGVELTVHPSSATLAAAEALGGPRPGLLVPALTPRRRPGPPIDPARAAALSAGAPSAAVERLRARAAGVPPEGPPR